MNYMCKVFTTVYALRQELKIHVSFQTGIWQISFFLRISRISFTFWCASSFLLGPFSLLSLNLLLDHPLDLIRQSKDVTYVTIGEEWRSVVATVGSLPSSNGP